MKIALKLPLLMALITIVALYLAELITTTNARATILAAGQDRLMAVASSRAAETYGVLSAVRADVRAKANNPVILEATRRFVVGWRLEGPDANAQLRAQYLTSGGAPADRRFGVAASVIGPTYAQVHRYYHGFFANHAASRDYADLYIVSPMGRVVYSTAKNDSFGSSLRAATARDSGLAKAFELVVAAQAKSAVTVTDFEPYWADPGEQSVFFGIPVRGDMTPLEGVMIIRLPARAIAKIAARREGLGETGLAALMGSDTQARVGRQIAFSHRPSIRDLGPNVFRDGGLASLGAVDAPSHLAAFVPFAFQGKRFVLVAWQTKQEILASANRLRAETLRDGVPALALVCVIGILLARSISHPLEAVGTAMGQVAGRDYEITIPARHRHDEIGDIARQLDLFRASLVAADATERENAFKSAAFEATSAALMLIDRHMTIIYVNWRLVDLMTQHRIALERNVSDFRPDALPGRGLAALFPGAARLQAEAATGHAAAEIRLGQSHLALSMAPVRAAENEQILGYVVEWNDVSRSRLSDAVMGALNATLPVASFSPDGRLIEFNTPFMRWVTLPGPTPLGQHWDTIFPTGPKSCKHPWKDIAKDNAKHQSLRVAPHRDHPLPAILSRVNNDRGRTQRFVLVVGSDIGSSHPHAPSPQPTARHQEAT